MDGSTLSSTNPEAVRPKRRKWSIEEQKRIVQASLKAGTTITAVARVYGVHPSQIYDWRKQYRQKTREGNGSALLPVHVAESVPPVPEAPHECNVVIEARSVRVTVSGCLDATVIRTLLEYLTQ